MNCRYQLAVAPAGPGTKLREIVRRLGLDRPGCGICDAWQRTMDFWGRADCEQHRELILARLNEAYRLLTWRQKCFAALAAVRRGLWLSPFDPATSLLNLALR